MADQEKMIPMDQARMRLALLWLIGAGIIVTLVFAQTLLGGLGWQTQAVWEWLLPTILPTVGTIISTLAATALLASSGDEIVHHSFLVLAEALSVFYLILLLLLIVLKGVISVDTPQWVQRLHQANLLLGPLQGFIATALGVIFLSKKQREGASV